MSENNHYLLTNGNIIDVENEVVIQGDIEIKGDKIVKIYHQESPPDGIPSFDIKGKYVIPGLIDMHCHIQEQFAPHFVASGVTTVRNAAGNVYMLKNLINAPTDAPTPRIYAADRMIDGPPGLWGPTSFGNLVTDDPNEARKEVRRQAAAGAKFIKVYGLISLDVLKATVDEAKKYELEVSVDLIHSKNVSALEAAKTGVTWFEHASGFVQSIYPGWHTLADEKEWEHINWEQPNEVKIKELCEQMLEYNVKICPTLVCNDQADIYPNYWSPENIVIDSVKNDTTLFDHWKASETQADAIKQQLGRFNKFTKIVAKTYFDLGGTVVTGTDTPALLWTYPGMALHRELELFVEIGFTEMETLQAATINAAKSINLDHVGVIKEGYFADLVVLDANPLENIQHTRKISQIIKGGKKYSQKDVLSHALGKENMEEMLKKFEEEWEKIMSESN